MDWLWITNDGGREKVPRQFINKASHFFTYTYTDLEGSYTLMFASEADSPEEMFDTYDHELKHCVEHICSFYGVHPKSETAAYLQGEIARNMFPAVAMAVCPKCHYQ